MLRPVEFRANSKFDLNKEVKEVKEVRRMIKRFVFDFMFPSP